MKLRTIFNYRKLLCNESKKFIRQSSTLAEAQSEDVIELNAQVHSAKSKVENSPVMVMLHGVFGNSRNFSALSRRIAKQCSIDVSRSNIITGQNMSNYCLHHYKNDESSQNSN